MILGANGQPISLNLPSLPSADEVFQTKKIDTYNDKVFVKWLIKKFQSIDPEVGAAWYPHTQCIVFWWYGIIIYKVMLTEHNVDDVSIERHQDKFRAALFLVKNDAGLRKRLRNAAKHHNKKFSKTL